MSFINYLEDFKNVEYDVVNAAATYIYDTYPVSMSNLWELYNFLGLERYLRALEKHAMRDHDT